MGRRGVPRSEDAPAEGAPAGKAVRQAVRERFATARAACHLRCPVSGARKNREAHALRKLEGARFCIECAAPLGRRCPGCGVENLPQAKFCAQCGGSLVVPPKADDRPREVEGKADTRREGERRQLTVMFCDVVGSTALSERLDPEEWRAVVRSYHAACTTVIRRFEGRVAQYLGDGLLVYFGYPQAHEDDAQRAVRAGLEIVSALETSSASPALVAGRHERNPERGLVGNVPRANCWPASPSRMFSSPPTL
jgi:hypothetical protein